MGEAFLQYTKLVYFIFYRIEKQLYICIYILRFGNRARQGFFYSFVRLAVGKALVDGHCK